MQTSGVDCSPYLGVGAVLSVTQGPLQSREEEREVTGTYDRILANIHYTYGTYRLIHVVAMVTSMIHSATPSSTSCSATSISYTINTS